MPNPFPSWRKTTQWTSHFDPKITEIHSGFLPQLGLANNYEGDKPFMYPRQTHRILSPALNMFHRMKCK